MSEDIYAKPDLTKKVRFQAGEKENTNADACDDIDNVRIYDNCWVEESTSQDKPQDNTTEDQQQTASVTVSSGKRNLSRAAGVLLGLLCLLLVAVVILVVLFILERYQLRDILQTSYSQMKRLNHNLTSERDELQTSYSQMKRLNHNLTQHTNWLEIEKDNLIAMNSNLTRERDELQKQIETCCPAKWIKFGGSCYFTSTSRKTWTESSRICVNNNATLVIVSSREEQGFLMLFKLPTWIGLTDEAEEGDWRWVNGTAVKPPIMYWRRGQPDNNKNRGSSENCAVISSRYPLNNWNDIICSSYQYFICEKRLQ